MTRQYRMTGDVMVSGMVTGTHIIEDIGVPVPHQIAVRIPAELAHRSRDLWRGLQQKRLFLLKGGSGLSVTSTPTPTPPAPAAPAAPVANGALEEENKRLRKELAATKKEATELRKALNNQGEKLEAILTAIGRLEGKQAVAVAEGVRAAVEAVGGEVPLFIPSDKLKPEDAEASIQVKESTSEGASVADAASKLKGLRKKESPD